MLNSTQNLKWDLASELVPVKARKVIYGLYALSAVLYGAVYAFFVGAGLVVPEWFLGVDNVIMFLGVPVTALAFINTNTTSTVTVPEEGVGL